MSTTNPTGITTQWEDLQVKYGNYDERPKPITNDEITKAAIEFAEQDDPLERKTLEQLHELEDEVEEDVLARYRKQRIAEIQAEQAERKFGSLLHLHKDEYTAEVTEASKEAPTVVHLYKEAFDECVLLNRCLAVLAKKFAAVKFMKAISTDVIENYPDRNLPTVLIYKNGVCVKQIIGGELWGGKAMTVDMVEWGLAVHDIVQTELEEDPREKKTGGAALLGNRQGKRDNDENDSSDDDREYSSLKVGRKKYRSYQ